MTMKSQIPRPTSEMKISEEDELSLRTIGDNEKKERKAIPESFRQVRGNKPKSSSSCTQSDSEEEEDTFNADISAPHGNCRYNNTDKRDLAAQRQSIMNNFNTKFSLKNINDHKFKMRLTIPIK